MRELIKAGLEDLERVVLSHDYCPAVSKGDLHLIVDIIFRSAIGLATLGGQMAALDLGNGYELLITMRKKDDQGQA